MGSFFANVTTVLSNLPQMVADKLGLGSLFATLQGYVSDFRDMVATKMLETLEKIISLPVLIGNKIYDIFVDMIKAVMLLPDKIAQIITFLLELPEKLIGLLETSLKGLFVPSDGFIQGKIDHFRQKLLQLGVGSYDMSGIFSNEQPFDDITCNIMGQTVTIVRMDTVDKVVAKFRPVIRGFMWLMMVFYNFNQFMGLIGQKGVTLGGIIKTASSHGEDN